MDKLGNASNNECMGKYLTGELIYKQTNERIEYINKLINVELTEGKLMNKRKCFE